MLSASQEDIAKVKGISVKKAEEIYLYLHKS
jgi:excinuclease ABC subunit C